MCTVQPQQSHIVKRQTSLHYRAVRLIQVRVKMEEMHYVFVRTYRKVRGSNIRTECSESCRVSTGKLTAHWALGACIKNKYN